MRLFALLMAATGFLVYLLNHMSFWSIFGIAYAVGMILVIMIACFSRHSRPVKQPWSQSNEVDEIN